MKVTGAPRRSLWSDPVFWFVLALGLVFGAAFNILPVSFPVFKTAFQSSLEQMGRTQLLFFISGILFSLIGGWLIDRCGLRRSSVLALLLLATAVLMIGGAPAFSVILCGAFCLGLAIQATYVISNSMISVFFEEKRQSVFFIWGVSDALGSVAGPLALGWWLTHAERVGGSWRTGYFAAASVPAALAIWALISQPKRLAVAGQTDKPRMSATAVMRSVLTEPSFYVACAAMLLHGLGQCGLVSWVGQLYQKRHNIDAASAAYLISFNSFGFFAGRSILGWVTSRWKIPELVLLAICAGSGTLAYVATISSPTYVWGLAMFALAGVCMSGNAPSINSYVALKLTGHVATAFAVVSGVSYIGAAAGSYLVGVIGSRFGLEIGIWFMPLFSLTLAALALFWNIHERSSARSVPVKIGI